MRIGRSRQIAIKWIALLFPFSLTAIEVPVTPEGAWFTGSLLAPPGQTIPLGHFNIEPYIYATANTGNYNSDWELKNQKTFWNIISQTTIEIGLQDWLDCELLPTFTYNYTHGAGKWVLNDLSVNLNFLLYHINPESVTDWDSSVKIYLREVFPIGKYQHLNPAKKMTDAGGQGSWQTGAGLVWDNMLYLGGVHFLHLQFAMQYTVPRRVHVHGLNFYGGTPGKSNTVFPGHEFISDLSIEISLSKNWAFAMDLVGTWAGDARLKGKRSLLEDPHSAAQFSAAPAIEYCWSAEIGLIAGCWFTFAGRNSGQFSSGVVAFNYYH